jgi:hypothetical protein
VLYREIGRVLRATLYLTLDPELAPVMSAGHRDLLSSLGQGFTAEALSRMLGLWLEHEALVRGAANRELALEVAALRLARWPTVQRIEAWLAGTSASGAGPPPDGPPSGSASPRTSRGSSATPSGAGGADLSADERGSDDAAATDDALAQEASSDPGVILATRILGGELVGVRSDGDGS